MTTTTLDPQEHEYPSLLEFKILLVGIRWKKTVMMTTIQRLSDNRQRWQLRA